MLNSETDGTKQEPKFVPSEFIQSYCDGQNSLIRDPVLADAIWISFCRHMLKWLLGKKKPVDIFFARLVPLLARKNWAQVLASQERSGPMRNKNRFTTNIKTMIKNRVHESAVDPKMLAMTENDGHCVWTIEVMTNRKWDDQVAKVETERKIRFGDHYLSSVLRQTKRQVPDLILAYAQFLSKARLPCIRISNGVTNIGWGKTTSGRRFPCHNPWVGVITPFSESDDRTDPTLGKTDAPLPSVPDLQSRDTIVRDPCGYSAKKWLGEWQRKKTYVGQCLSGSTG